MSIKSFCTGFVAAYLALNALCVAVLWDISTKTGMRITPQGAVYFTLVWPLFQIGTISGYEPPLPRWVVVRRSDPQKEVM